MDSYKGRGRALCSNVALFLSWWAARTSHLPTFEPHGGDSPLKDVEVRCGIFYDMKTDAANKLKDG
jgi:hypothetical protein